MTANLGAFRMLLDGVSGDQARWKPAPEKWSVLELTNHLYEEEFLDFRVRVEFTLLHPGREWPPWDPVGAVTDRAYNSRDFTESKQDFFDERRKSVDWLKGLESPGWDRVYSHPKIGELRAGDLLAAWLAHDYLHLRQLSDLLLEYTKSQAQPYDTRYAAP
jgi:hypothetical protein